MKKVCAIIVTAFLLPSCGLIAQKRQQEAFQLLYECPRALYCDEDQVRRIVAESGYPYMDLANLRLAYLMALRERIKKGELSVEEANLQSAELLTRIASEEQRTKYGGFSDSNTGTASLESVYDLVV